MKKLKNVISRVLEYIDAEVDQAARIERQIQEQKMKFLYGTGIRCL